MREEVEKLVDESQEKTFTHPRSDIQTGLLTPPSKSIALGVNGSEPVEVKNMQQLDALMLNAKSLVNPTKRQGNLNPSEYKML
jgi:hypothetical protein